MLYRKSLTKDGMPLSAIGFGCMGISDFYGAADLIEGAKVINTAFNEGINFFDTADMYAYGENEKFVGKAIAPFRDKIVLATKCGIIRKLDDPNARGVSNAPQYIRQCCDASLKRLKVDCIDLYYLHRYDPNTPIEDSIGTLSDLVSAGKIKYIGLSEFSAANIRKAHSIHPVSCVQSEFSLWTRHVETNGVLATCRELGIVLAAYSPLGRGFLTGKIKSFDELSANDVRRTMPRFQGDALKSNLKLVALLEEMAAKKNCTTAQLALAWVLAQDEIIVPIPGTKRLKYLHDNIDAVEKVKLDKVELKYLDKISKKYAPVGARYNPETMAAFGFEE